MTEPDNGDLTFGDEADDGPVPDFPEPDSGGAGGGKHLDDEDDEPELDDDDFVFIVEGEDIEPV